ncbi:MAG: hypothetical protein QY317_15820 [Candidatus Jettenia caeni]|nr:MAG: hypothetical protein QY317_15820 [Candidatus Jettenia caeni]
MISIFIMNDHISNTTNISLLLQNLYHESTERVRQTLEEIGKAGKGNHEVMKALQEFLQKEKQMPLRILAAQTISRVKTIAPRPTEEFKKPGILQCPGAERIKRVEIIDVLCPHCHREVTASIAGFEYEFACENCGEMMQRDIAESCIEKCPVGSKCVGEERYQKYLKGRRLGGNYKT